MAAALRGQRLGLRHSVGFRSAGFYACKVQQKHGFKEDTVQRSTNV